MKTFREFLAEVKANALSAYENQDYQFEELVERLNIRRDLSRNPLFDTMFGLQNMDHQELSIEKLQFRPYPLKSNIAKFDLTLLAVESENNIKFSLEYCTKLYLRETVTGIAGHYLQIIKQITANPQRKLKDIDILTDAEKHQILYEFNNTAAEYPKDKTIHELFEAQVARTPEKIALVYEDQELTYRELNRKANQLARVLRNKGVKADTIVGIMVERSFEMIIGILGILKAGGAYLPIDPEYPEERIKFMLEDSGAKILLTQSHLQNKFIFNGEIIDLASEKIYHGSRINPKRINQPQNLAYMIYTSGSTGKPKGVIVTHQAVGNFIQGITSQINFSSNKVMLCLTSVSFDIFVLETLLPLSKGLKIIIANENQQRDPWLLNEIILRNRVNMLQTTPSRMQMLINNSLKFSNYESLTEIMIGGEAFPENLFKGLSERVQSARALKIYNMYGPTETTVWSTFTELKSDRAINIGKPISNTQIYIIDQL